jgi:uncharacterized peroxidase-related enzyme
LSELDRNRLIETLKSDYASAEVPPQDRQMLDYAVKLTARPAAVTSEDIGRLREAGFNARAIHDICAITAYYAFVNRMADGLGVEIERS